MRGALRTSRHARWDAVDAEPAKDERKVADGEGVWFWHRGAGVKFPGSFPGATAARKPFAGKSTL
jgi:hypothetical protein